MSEKVTELTNEMLKDVLKDALVFRDTKVLRIEDCVTWGVYSVDINTTTTEPEAMGNWNFGWLEVFVRGADVMQRLTHVGGLGVFYRVRRDGHWLPWVRLG